MVRPRVDLDQPRITDFFLFFYDEMSGRVSIILLFHRMQQFVLLSNDQHVHVINSAPNDTRFCEWYFVIRTHVIDIINRNQETSSLIIVETLQMLLSQGSALLNTYLPGTLCVPDTKCWSKKRSIYRFAATNQNHIAVV